MLDVRKHKYKGFLPALFRNAKIAQPTFALYASGSRQCGRKMAGLQGYAFVLHFVKICRFFVLRLPGDERATNKRRVFSILQILPTCQIIR